MGFELRQPRAGFETERTEIRSGSNPGRQETLTLSSRDQVLSVRDLPGRDLDDEPGAPVGRIVLVSGPKIRAVYWCRFWRDALSPEFYKTRPVVIVSRDNRLDGPALVVPLTTKPQGNNRWAYKLTENPNPRKPSIDSWAVCNHIYAVSCARLTQMDGHVRRMKPADFDQVVRLMLQALPDPPPNAT
jgi:mRNA interferase MazF